MTWRAMMRLQQLNLKRAILQSGSNCIGFEKEEEEEEEEGGGGVTLELEEEPVTTIERRGAPNPF
jgi:hypothetical protein